MSKLLASVVLCGLTLLISACASTHYDPVPAANAKTVVTRYPSPLSIEDSYRRLYARLRECVPGFYHVQPRYNHQIPMASVMVVQGLGLNRYSFVGNSFLARFDIYRAATGSRIEITNVDEDLVNLITASRDWLDKDHRSCSAIAPA